MKIFRMGRGEGKTSKLIAESANSGVPIFVINERKRRDLIEKASMLGYTVPSPITFDDLATDNPPEKVIIDDAEYTMSALIEYFLGVHVVAEAFSTNSLSD